MTPRRLIEPARLAGTTLLRSQSDARLVDLVRAGHAAAFEAIVQRYRKQLLAYCSRLLPASRAEDAVQTTFLKAYQAMVSGDAELNLRPWLYKIAHNASLNLLRQNGWHHEELNENMDGVLRPDQALETRERLRSTVAAIKALPERQRNAVLMREVEGLSYEQIALALGVGDGAVRQLLHRARATLRAGATAVTPAGLVERLAASVGTGGDPATRVTELAAGLGAGAGALKLGAAVLATGVIATGAITVPLARHELHGASHRTISAKASGVADASAAPDPATAPPAGGTSPSRLRVRVNHPGGGRGRSGGRSPSRHTGEGKGGGQQLVSLTPGGPGPSGRTEHGGGSSGKGGSGDGAGGGDKSGSGGGGGSGSGDTTSGSGDHSGSGDGGSGGGAQTSGDGGLQTITTPTTTTPDPTSSDPTTPDGGGDSGSGGRDGSSSGSGSGSGG